MYFDLSFKGLVLLFVAGMLGALCRLIFIEVITFLYDKTLKILPYPHHTFAVNVIACFLTGLLTAHFALDPPKSQLVNSLIITGFLGAFSTFSTYIVDIVMHFKDGKTSFAIAYAVLTLAISFGGGLFGRFLAGGFS